MRFELLEQRLALATLTVTSLADGPENLTDAVVTLRDALHAADNNLQVAPGGATGGVTDDVVFQPGLVGEITLTQGQLEIRSDVTLTGPGANVLTIKASNDSRVIDVNDQSPDIGSVRTVAISGLTLTGGNVPTYHGGAILNGEALTITGCTIRDNVTAMSGGGVFNIGAGSKLDVRNSTISGNVALGDGGGIASHGALTVQNSTIHGNTSAGAGGGVANWGTLTIDNSTISGNRADASGGGVASFDAWLYVRNTTITLNHNDNDDASFSGFGGGIRADNTVLTLHNALVADNYYGSGSAHEDDVASGGINATIAFSLIGIPFYGISYLDEGNQIGVPDPGLGPLADNGGPTMTHRLFPTSPAIDAGGPAFTAPPEFDQRGAPFARNSNGVIDIGAYELQAASADFDGDNDVDGFDFLAWQRGFGTTGGGATRAQGNADDDSDVDGVDMTVWKSTFDNPPLSGNGNGLLGAYFNNLDFIEPVLERTDPTVNFPWGLESPDTAIGVDEFSVRWTGQVEARFTETFTFRTTSDDGVRLWINNQLLIDQWYDHSATNHLGSIALVAGQRYDVRMEYYENAGLAVAKLGWLSPSQPFQIIPQSQLYSDPPGVPAGALAASAGLESDDSPSRLSPQAVDAAMAWQMAAEAPASRPLFRPRWLRAR